MKSKIPTRAYGDATEAQYKQNGLRLPRTWKVMTSTLLLLFTFAIGNVWAADYLINVESGNLSSDSKWYEVASVGGVTNKTGSTWSSADYSCTPVGAKIGSSNFTVRTDLANTTQITVVASSGSNRTISGVKTGSSLSSLTTATGCTSSGSVTKNNCGQVLTFTFSPALSAGTYVNIAMSGNMNVHSVTITAGAVTKHTVTYDLNGATGTTPTQADVAEGAKFTLHNGTTGITAPTNKDFDGWHDGTTKYAGGAEYTMGTSNVTLTAQWVDHVANYTVIYKDGTTELGSETVEVGQHPTGSEIAAPTKDCYTFAGWDPALSGVSGSDGDEIEVNATWTPVYASSFNFGTTTDLTKDNIATKLAASNIFCSVGTGGSYDAGETTGYLGYKFKNNGDYVTFIVQNGYEATVTYGYTESGWQVNGADAGVTVKTKAYVDKKYKAEGSDLLLKLINQSANSKTSVLTNIVIKVIAAGDDDATLSDLSVSGYTLSPAFASATEEYTITKEYGADDPAVSAVTATPSVTGANAEVTWDGTNHKFVITVTAKDNVTTKTYNITINEAEAKRDLLEVVFSNGAKGAINAGTKEIRVPYIGSDAPTFVSAAFASWVEGASAVMDEGKLKVTGADSNYDEYTIVPVQLNVAGVALDEDITFDGVPAYIFAPYGWDSGKGVKFAKNQEQEANRRVSSGNSRIYIAVPTGVAYLQLTSGSAANRNVVIKVNGVTSTVTKTAAANSAIELAMDPAIVNFVYIENNSGSGGGDAGFIKMHLVPAYSVTYSAGEGSVKSGETLPTQASVAAGTEITLAMDNALEKDGYDFDGWLCDIDAVKYAAGAHYTMTAAPTTFTAQWILHVDPVDPTLTYDEGAYTTGGAALDLSSLITAKTSTGAITYSVKDAGTTGATIDGVNFTATAAGTAVITASQAAVSGYNAKSVDFNVVVTEPAEKDGIKMVEAAALTGNFRIKADQLKSGSYIVDGISYTKYVQMSSTHTSFSGETEGNQSKGIYYAPAKKNIKFWFYMRNTDSSARKIYIYKMEEGSSIASETVTVDPGSQLVSYDMTLTTNAEVIFGVENTKLYFCQIVAVESGDALLQGGEAGYVFDYSKKRQNVAANTVRTIDGIDYKLSAESKINSASNVQLQTLGTHYIKFHLDAPMTVNVYADNKKYYIGSECSTDAAAMTYEATGDGEFSLADGDWYINGSGVQVKINKLSFSAPKCAEPSFDALANSDICSGDPYVALDGTATVADAGVPTYQWYKEDNTPIDGATSAEYTPTEDGKYYVIAINHLAGFTDNEKKSDLVTVATVAGTVINAAPANVRDDAGEEATLTVDASGKDLHYVWKECATIDGTYTDVAGAADAASLVVTVPTGVKYYKVVVSSACGADAEAIAKVEEWVDFSQVNVSENTNWDFTTCADAEIKLTDATTPKKGEEYLMANIRGVHYDDPAFNAQALIFAGEYIYRNVTGKPLGAIKLKFTTTVDGFVTVRFADNGNNNRCLRVTDSEGVEFSQSSASNSDIQEFTTFVHAGDIEIMGVKEDHTGENQYVRIFNLAFEKADYSRAVNAGRYGTICLPNGGVMKGAEIFEVAYYGATSQKIFFDQIMDGVMEAGVPYLFLPKEGYKYLGVEYTDALNASATNRNGLYGSYTKEELPTDGSCYILLNNQYCQVLSAENYVGANKAYFKLGDITPTAPALAPGRIRMSIGAAAPQVATGIDQITNDQLQMTDKVIIDGRLFIIRGEKMYDATGRLVK